MCYGVTAGIESHDESTRTNRPHVLRRSIVWYQWQAVKSEKRFPEQYRDETAARFALLRTLDRACRMTLFFQNRLYKRSYNFPFSSFFSFIHGLWFNLTVHAIFLPFPVIV